MKIIRGLHNLLRHPQSAGPGCALSIGNFDGVHRGHQAMLALLINEARHRGVPSCAMIFEPHPRDYFAAKFNKPELAPARIATLRDKLHELRRCGIEQCVILPFDDRLATQPAQEFIDQILVGALGVRYMLVGDDFRFGAQRQGDYAMLDAAGAAQGFDVARMLSYEVHGLRVSSSAVRGALAGGDMARAAVDLPTGVLRMAPPAYVLGKGHVSFFYDKGAYLRRRYDVEVERQESSSKRELTPSEKQKLLDAETMEVRAALGSADRADAGLQGQVDGTRAKRSPGWT